MLHTCSQTEQFLVFGMRTIVTADFFSYCGVVSPATERLTALLC